MFAFAIWDTRARTLFLARDRMGVKPLYYAETPRGFVFGSEIKAILASRLLPMRCREEALAEYMVFRQVAGNETLFHGVNSLPPACTMIRANGRGRISRYWSPQPPPDRLPVGFQEARRTLAGLLQDSVKMRMISDVPLGTFCSGGLDSSLVTAIAASLKGEPVNTFSVGFEEPDYDESGYAALVSRRYGTVHHELRLTNAEYSELLPQMVWHNDEPLNFANSVQIFALSRLARQHVTVVLTGEGSDELFAGYPRYRIPGLTRSYRHVPAPLRRLLALGSRDHRLDKLNRYVDRTADDVLLFNSSFVQATDVATLCPSLPAPVLDYRRQSLEKTAALARDDAARLSLLDQETYLVSILHRQDKMSMAACIESRVPFMDYRIVELANGLPTAHKIRYGSAKALVKAVARDWLPAEIVNRRKSGFGVPLERWFRANSGLGERLLALCDSAPSDIFDRAVLKRLTAEHRSGERDHSEILWAALNVCLWRDAFPC